MIARGEGEDKPRPLATVPRAEGIIVPGIAGAEPGGLGGPRRVPGIVTLKVAGFGHVVDAIIADLPDMSAGPRP